MDGSSDEWASSDIEASWLYRRVLMLAVLAWMRIVEEANRWAKNWDR